MSTIHSLNVMESIVEYFFIGKQKIVLFPKYRESGWKSAANALMRENYTLPYRLALFCKDISKV